MTELSKKYGNTKNWIRFVDMEKGIFLAVMVLVLKEGEKACLWMNFSRVHCGKDWKQLGMALGSIASYASAKDVPFVRIIFCDAKATDAGYLAPEEIAGKVKVTGRGGTILQPGC